MVRSSQELLSSRKENFSGSSFIHPSVQHGQVSVLVLLCVTVGVGGGIDWWGWVLGSVMGGVECGVLSGGGGGGGYC